MPITAKFEADFTDFSRAVQDADLQLRSFEDDSRKVALSLGRMADSFSGRTIVQEATLMAEAIERLGGVTALTFTEITRVGTATQAALAKIQVMGLEAPAALQRVAAATREAQLAMAQYATQVVTTTEAIAVAGSSKGLAGLGGGLPGGILNVAGLGAVGRLAAAGGGLGIASAAVVLLGKDLLDTADAMQKMSDQTGLTLGEVQQLQYVSDQTSVSMQSLVAATQNMQRGLGAGDKGLTKLLKDLNIEFASFKALKPWDQMIQLADAIDQLDDPTQQAIAGNAAFGKAWKETIAAIRGGMRDLSNDAPMMADDTARALDFIGDKIGWLWAETKNWLADLVTAPFRVVDAGRALVGLESLFPERKKPAGGGLGLPDDDAPEQTRQTKRATDEYEGSVKRADDTLRRFNAQLDETNKKYGEQREEIRKTIEAQQQEDDKYVQQITGLDKFNEAVTNVDRLQRLHVDITALSLEAATRLNAETNAAIEIAVRQTSTDAGLMAQLQALSTATAAHIAVLQAEQEAMRKSVAEANALTEAYLNAEQAAIGFTAQQAFERSGQASGMTPAQLAGFKEGIVVTGQSAADAQRSAAYDKLLKELNAPLVYGTGVAPVAPPVAAPGRAGAASVVQNFNVNGTGRDVANIAMAEMAKVLSVGTNWALTRNG